MPDQIEGTMISLREIACDFADSGRHERCAVIRDAIDLIEPIQNGRGISAMIMQAMAEQIGAETVDDFDARAEELAIMEIHYDACRDYLKEGETPAQCIQRNRDDVSLALGELARRKGELQEARKTVIWLGVGLLVSAVLFLVEHWP